jgi:hypothetical protein
MARYTALRAFPLSRNGVQIEEIEAGAIVEVPEHLAPGLEREDYIASAAESKLPIEVLELQEPEPKPGVVVEEPRPPAPPFAQHRQAGRKKG